MSPFAGCARTWSEREANAPTRDAIAKHPIDNPAGEFPTTAPRRQEPDENLDRNERQTVASAMWELFQPRCRPGVTPPGVTPVLSIGVMKARAFEYYAR